MSDPVSERVRLRRRPPRGRHDRETIDAILDEGLVVHVAFSVPGPTADPAAGHVAVVPTAYLRDGDHVVLHGSSGNRMLRSLRDGPDACLCVTLLDGLVLARSAFHHSMNYRSVVLYGRGEEVGDASEKRRLLERFVERIVPGRSGDARPPNDAELRQTLVIRFRIDEASAKVRTGPPIDDEADLALPHWAGEVPFRLERGAPVPAPELAPDAPLPDYLKR